MGLVEMHLIALMRVAWTRLTALARDETGYTTETIVITSVLALLAIVLGVIITTKVLAAGNAINLNTSGN